jgi:chromosome segregation ATPase
MVEPPSQPSASKKSLSKFSQDNSGSVEHSSSVEGRQDKASEKSYEDDEDDDGDEDDDATASVSTSRKRPGSALMKGSSNAKKAKPGPSIHGAAYDDLRDRANIRLKQKDEDHAASEARNAELEKENALLRQQLSLLEKQGKARVARKAVKEAKYEADLAAIERESRAFAKADFEKKHKTNMEIKDRRHKEDIARMKEKMVDAQQGEKIAKVEAKEKNPEHSKLVQKQDKTIASLKETNSNLEGISDQLKAGVEKLKTDRTNLRKVVADLSDTMQERSAKIGKLNGEVEKHKAIIDSLKKAHSTYKTEQGLKWQIQYDNAQTSARRASDSQRTVSTMSFALNKAVEARIKAEDRISALEAEIRKIRVAETISKGEGIPKGENGRQTIEG